MAKATGMVRKLDDLGRVVIPNELRKVMGLQKGDPLEIYVDDDKMYLKLYNPGCFLCGDVGEDMMVHNGKSICKKCAREISLRMDAGRLTR